MAPKKMTPNLDAFWALTSPWQELEGVTRATMMGYPCLRVDGSFFTSLSKDGDALVTKLPAEDVAAYIDEGIATAFAPGGRPFKEWASFGWDCEDRWPEIIEQSYLFVKGA